jgi:hypothetical protein
VGDPSTLASVAVFPSDAVVVSKLMATFRGGAWMAAIKEADVIVSSETSKLLARMSELENVMGGVGRSNPVG